MSTNEANKSAAVTQLAAAYGPPSQAGFGSAVFDEPLDAGADLSATAQEKYRYFVGELWDRYGEDAWMGPWREVYSRPPDATHDIVAELGSIDDREAALSAPMILDNDPAALAAVFDDPAVTELRVFNLGDGGAMSGLLIAGRRTAAGEATFLVFLLD